MVSDLGDLLRASLATHDRDTVPLHEEIAFAERYIAIERVRFGDRLQVHWRIDPSVEYAALPRLVVQPLVENAIRHGLAKGSSAGLLEIAAFRVDDMVCVTVQDDGQGLSDAVVSTGGVGISATRARLRLLYADRASLTLRSAGIRGAIAELRVPHVENHSTANVM